MPTYIKTLSFSTSSKFNPKKDDPKVNAALQQLQSQGAEISDIKVTLGGQLLDWRRSGLLDHLRGPHPHRLTKAG